VTTRLPAKYVDDVRDAARDAGVEQVLEHYPHDEGGQEGVEDGPGHPEEGPLVPDGHVAGHQQAHRAPGSGRGPRGLPRSGARRSAESYNEPQVGVSATAGGRSRTAVPPTARVHYACERARRGVGEHLMAVPMTATIVTQSEGPDGAAGEVYVCPPARGPWRGPPERLCQTERPRVARTSSNSRPRELVDRPGTSRRYLVDPDQLREGTRNDGTASRNRDPSAPFDATGLPVTDER
jgi:hypothetical protein